MCTSSMSQQAIEHNIPAKSTLQKPTQLNVNISAAANAFNKMKWIYLEHINIFLNQNFERKSTTNLRMNDVVIIIFSHDDDPAQMLFIPIKTNDNWRKR